MACSQCGEEKRLAQCESCLLEKCEPAEGILGCMLPAGTPRRRPRALRSCISCSAMTRTTSLELAPAPGELVLTTPGNATLLGKLEEALQESKVDVKTNQKTIVFSLSSDQRYGIYVHMTTQQGFAFLASRRMRVQHTIAELAEVMKTRLVTDWKLTDVGAVVFTYNSVVLADTAVVGKPVHPRRGRPFAVELGDTHLLSDPVRHARTEQVDWNQALVSTTTLSTTTAQWSPSHMTEFWTASGLAEHASIASFNKLVLDLMSVRAPAALLLRTQQAAMDEVRHAQFCFHMASLYADANIGPSQFPLPAQLTFSADLASIALATVHEACVEETVSAVLCGVMLDALKADKTTPVEVLSQMKGVVEDETAHALLAYDTVSWLLAEAKRTNDLSVQVVVLDAFDGLSSETLAVNAADVYISVSVQQEVHEAMVTHALQPWAFKLWGSKSTIADVEDSNTLALQAALKFSPTASEVIRDRKSVV